MRTATAPSGVTTDNLRSLARTAVQPHLAAYAYEATSPEDRAARLAEIEAAAADGVKAAALEVLRRIEAAGVRP